MNKKTIRGFIFLFLAVLAVVSVPVYAHPGRTDGAGGHMNHSTGKYHYHHGYDDHQHYDMDGDGIKDCPYDFRNIETKNSSSDSTTKGNSGGQEEKQDAKSSPSTKQVIGKILVVIMFGPLILYVPVCLIALIYRDVRDLIHKLKKKLKLRG